MKTQRIRHPLLIHRDNTAFRCRRILEGRRFFHLQTNGSETVRRSRLELLRKSGIESTSELQWYFRNSEIPDVLAQNLTAPVPVPEPAGNHLPPVILRPPALNVWGVLCEEIGKLCFPAVQPKGKPFPNGVFSLLHSASPFRKSPISPARISCPKSLGCRPSVVSFAAISGSFARITLVSNKSSRGRP